MSKVLVTSSYLGDIANAIRAKNGEETTYRPGDMAQAIREIAGGEAIIEPLTVTENGVYTPPEGVDGYGPVTVNVQPNLQTKTATQNGTIVPDSGYDGLSQVVVDVSGGDSGPVLPAEYQRVAWLRITGTQYSSIPIAVPAGAFVMIDCDRLSTNSAEQAFFGSDASGEAFEIYSSNASLDTNLTFYSSMSAIDYLYTKQTLSDGVRHMAGARCRSAITTTSYVGRYTSSRYPLLDGRVRLISFWSINAGEGGFVTQRLFDIVPCYRLSDGEMGFYSTQTETFYPNAGTGTYEKGADVA